MSSSKDPIQFKLTQEQQDVIRRATGKHAEALQFSAEELEQRIAPMKFGYPKTVN